MSNPVIEITTFKLAANVTDSAFAIAAEAAGTLLGRQPGFVARRLSQAEDGRYVDHIEWSSLAEAKAAIDRVMSDPGIAPFLHAIDPTSIVMQHNRLVTKVN
jgi:hypothetical protein